MKIALVQFQPKFGELNYNANYVLDKAVSVASDVIVFPELCLSGYDFISKSELNSLSHKLDSQIFADLQSIATEQNKIIVIGFGEKVDDDNFYNSAMIISPDGKKHKVYRKTHLFFRERFVFNEGDSGFFVLDFPEFDLRLGTMICYDWRFPEAARTLGLLGADLIVCPSNLVTNVWHISTPSRALENKVYLAVCNRIGTEHRNEDELIFNGMSAIYSYNGEEMAKASRNTEEIIFSEIFPNKTRTKSFNEYNDIFKDRRTKYYL